MGEGKLSSEPLAAIVRSTDNSLKNDQGTVRVQVPHRVRGHTEDRVVIWQLAETRAGLVTRS